jgi:RNA polymerase sigma-70 factor (ECF subfamily)
MVGKKQFEDILADHGNMMARIVASYEADPVLQQDMMQDVALALWRALPSFKGESQLKTFIARIAHNRSISHVKKEINVPKPVEVDSNLEGGGQGPEGHLVEKQKVEKLIEKVRGMPLNLRPVATLALEGFGPAEIAETLGISANNASVRLNRAKEWLKKEMAS